MNDHSVIVFVLRYWSLHRKCFDAKKTYSFWSCCFFDIHISVHRKYNSKLQPTRCKVSWFIYFYRRSTCFRRFLHPSSGAHICTYSFSYSQPILLPAGVMDEMERSSISSMTYLHDIHPWHTSHEFAGRRPATSWGVHYTSSCNTQSSPPEDGQNNFSKHVELTGIINKPLLLRLFGCLYYLYQWCTVKQISDTEIYLLIKYIKSVLWRVAKRPSLYRGCTVPKV